MRQRAVAFLTDGLSIVNTQLLAAVAMFTIVACSSTEDVVVAGSTTFGPSEKRIELDDHVRAGRAFNGILIKVPPGWARSTTIGGIAVGDGIIVRPEASIVDKDSTKYPLDEYGLYQVQGNVFYSLFSRRLPSHIEFVAIAIRSEREITTPEIRWIQRDPK
jgi:hypothetical protein